ncbi:MAG TPA: ABC transporter ATP-binding protein [Candidatus Limnocylindria bacterium]|nr:ABC transporter ATP-binding protein [Candidatus Limnocylindria bacterium]
MKTATPDVSRASGRGASIEVSHLSVSYAGADATAAGTLAVDDISFTVGPGEIVVVVGPSGCGKSTLLKAVAGLLTPSRGAVRVGGADASREPRIGFVFQSDALLPWRTAVQNVELAVRLAGENASVARERARRLMTDLGLGDSCDKFPAQLSGGMRKRVSLARALAYEPAVFLMDEPFAALDAHTRIHVGNFFLRILESYQQSVIFVTHDIDEAVALGDRILVMSRRPGRLLGSFDVPLPRPRDYYASRFSDGFRETQKKVWELLG